MHQDQRSAPFLGLWDSAVAEFMGKPLARSPQPIPMAVAAPWYGQATAVSPVPAARCTPCLCRLPRGFTAAPTPAPGRGLQPRELGPRPSTLSPRPGEATACSRDATKGTGQAAGLASARAHAAGPALGSVGRVWYVAAAAAQLLLLAHPPAASHVPLGHFVLLNALKMPWAKCLGLC